MIIWMVKMNGIMFVCVIVKEYFLRMIEWLLKVIVIKWVTIYVVMMLMEECVYVIVWMRIMMMEYAKIMILGIVNTLIMMMSAFMRCGHVIYLYIFLFGAAIFFYVLIQQL